MIALFYDENQIIHNKDDIDIEFNENNEDYHNDDDYNDDESYKEWFFIHVSLTHHTSELGHATSLDCSAYNALYLQKET